ncbi:hypothetical protein [Actinomadura livida]|uniref:Uncharacterized protein n=1 Tax=Actinomadura livida TaxID=79909 RepID=A0A7W7I9X9_9ACTN|nr:MULTISPECIES: hypothetical protein [Actinomadura]MBB4773128.1 hypothetical protein [Actinomadura catellatispora]GGU18186.1 hypothetical protein GCM10010208_49130 [Actinomadura livida]
MRFRSVRYLTTAVAAVAAVILLTGLALRLHTEPPAPEPPYRGPPAAPGTPAAEATGTRRIALNTEPADYPRLRALGYDLVDVAPDAEQVDGVPPGMEAMLWVGNYHCDDFVLGFQEFKDAVDRFGRDPRVFGWYLSDEPNAGDCPGVAGEIRRRAEYIERNAPGQVSFVSLTDFPMEPLTPGRVGVDLFGLDPYPCKGSADVLERCDIGAIDRMVRMADDAGIPRDRIAPVLQTFGQSCSDGDKQYWLPTRAQFLGILARWDRLAPRPPLEISYSWGHQDEWACPTLADAAGGEHPDLQSIMKARNSG